MGLLAAPYTDALGAEILGPLVESAGLAGLLGLPLGTDPNAALAGTSDASTASAGASSGQTVGDGPYLQSGPLDDGGFVDLGGLDGGGAVPGATGSSAGPAGLVVPEGDPTQGLSDDSTASGRDGVETPSPSVVAPGTRLAPFILPDLADSPSF